MTPLRKLAALAIAVSFLSVTPAAADTVSAAGLKVRPIEEVFTDGPPRIEDLTSLDGILRFVSSVPLACSMVYGETSAFGQITVDQDMNGGAHTDHHPAITGLKPDTTYFYRVQGTAVDGTLYVSTVQTFHTPKRDANAAANLALLEAGARVTAVSSNFGGGANDASWGANSAIDGSRATEWSTDGDGDKGFIEIEFAEPSDVGAIEVWTRSMSNNTARIFEFIVTADNGQKAGPFKLPDASKPYRFDVDLQAKRLRLDVIASNGGNVGLVEFAAYSR
ncbi:MAG: discoidin domain-containing protein [Alphaproteobacteria bacterium]